MSASTGVALGPASYILNDVAVVADEEPCTTVGHVDLHSDQPYGKVSADKSLVGLSYHQYDQANGAA